MTSSYAHNSGFPGYWELRRAVWDSGEPLIVKALALAIMEHMRPDKLEANPSRARLAKMCSISENTLERHWGAISKWIDIIKRQGRVSVYRARIYDCASELLGMLPPKPPQAMGGSLPKAPPIDHPTHRVPPIQSTTQSGGVTTPHAGGAEDTREDLRKTPVSAQAREVKNPAIWNYNAEIDRDERSAQHDVGWAADNGQLVVMNGFVAELNKLFPRVDVAVGLQLVEASIGDAKKRMPAKQVKERIIWKFGHLEHDERGKDRRYGERAAQKPPPTQPVWVVDRDNERAKSRRHANVIAELAQKQREGKL